MKTAASGNIGIIVFSCDKYSDLWESFFHFFDKYWNDCPYPVYLATNTKPFNKSNLQLLFSNQFTKWGAETLLILNQLNHDYLIYFQDDYFLTQKVNNEEIEKLFSKMQLLNADYIRLFPSPGPDIKIEGEKDFGIIGANALYRTSLQCAIWKRDAFKKLITPGESNWEFEINSVNRSKDMLFLSVYRHAKEKLKKTNYPINYYYLTAVYKGKWLRNPLMACLKEGLTPDLSYRKAENYWDTFHRSVYGYAPKPVQHILDFINNKFNKKN